VQKGGLLKGDHKKPFISLGGSIKTGRLLVGSGKP